MAKPGHPFTRSPGESTDPPRTAAKDKQTSRQEARRDSAIVFSILLIHAVYLTLFAPASTRLLAPSSIKSRHYLK